MLHCSQPPFPSITDHDVRYVIYELPHSGKFGYVVDFDQIFLGRFVTQQLLHNTLILKFEGFCLAKI